MREDSLQTGSLGPTGSKVGRHLDPREVKVGQTVDNERQTVWSWRYCPEDVLCGVRSCIRYNDGRKCCAVVQRLPFDFVESY